MPWMVAVIAWDAERSGRRSFADDGKTFREILADQFKIYCPKIRELVVVNRRRVWRTDFLFGRYAFVLKDDRWRKLYRTRGIVEVLGRPENPALARDDEVDRFKQLEDSEGFVALPDVRRMRRGDACRVVDGPFRDWVGVYRGMGRRDCELALVQFMGQQVRVEVAAGALEPA